MRIGDLVLCKNGFNKNWYDGVLGTELPLKGKVYTIRYKTTNGGLLLEEIVNKKHYAKSTFPFFAKKKFESTFCKKGFKKIKSDNLEITTLIIDKLLNV